MQKKSHKPLVLVVFLAILLLGWGLGSDALAMEVTLEWDANPPSDEVTHYTVY